jgi:hypothetical protein
MLAILAKLGQSEWIRAPILLFKKDPLGALCFYVPNFLCGTIGLWLPPANAFYNNESVGQALGNQFREGGFYLYGIIFLAAIGGATLPSIAKDKAEYSRTAKLIILGLVGIAFFFGALFLQNQVVHPVTASLTVRATIVQSLYFFVAALIGIYAYGIFTLEMTGSPREDIDEGAKLMLDKSKAPEVPPNGWSV